MVGGRNGCCGLERRFQDRKRTVVLKGCIWQNWLGTWVVMLSQKRLNEFFARTSLRQRLLVCEFADLLFRYSLCNLMGSLPTHTYWAFSVYLKLWGYKIFLNKTNRKVALHSLGHLDWWKRQLHRQANAQCILFIRCSHNAEVQDQGRLIIEKEVKGQSP